MYGVSDKKIPNAILIFLGAHGDSKETVDSEP
jgi:hypothetical protein